MTTRTTNESGMTLLAVMAFMAVFAIALMAVAPSVQIDVQREKELESIRRGEEIAEAIRQYVIYYKGAKLPQSMDNLLEGLPNGTKKRQILRPSATTDPLSDDGKWLLVPADPKDHRIVRKKGPGIQPRPFALLARSRNISISIRSAWRMF